MNKRITAFILTCVMIMGITTAYANPDVEHDTETLTYQNYYDGDKSILFAENFSEPVNELWANSSKENFSLEKDGDNAYGKFVKGVINTINFPKIVSDDRLVIEFDYRGKNTGDKYIYLDNSRNVGYGRIYLQKEGKVTGVCEVLGESAKQIDIASGLAEDTWHHVKWGIDVGKGTETVFVDGGEGVTYDFFMDPDTDVRRCMIRTGGDSEYFDLDNIQIYTIDTKPAYTVDSINYSTEKEYPTADAVIKSVNIIKNKDKAVNTSLIIAVFDGDGVLQASTHQPINNADFTGDAPATIALKNELTIPSNFDFSWKIRTLIWNDTEDVLIAEKFEDAYNVVLQSPVTRAVFQRDEMNIGKVKVKGIINAKDVVGLEASAVVDPEAFNGDNVDWTPLEYTPGSDTFDTVFSVPAGGWYTIKVRAVLADGGYVQTSIDKIGVGEVFLTTGQSNSSNHGGESAGPGFRLTKAAYDTISMYDVMDGEWALCKDPQFNPYTNANKTPGVTGSTPWPSFANELMENIRVPIGLISIGRGSQPIGNWDPDKNAMYQMTADTLKTFGENGVRAVLFHQGEQNDSDDSEDAQEKYRAAFEKFLTALRADIGWNVPFVIANVGTHGKEAVDEFGNPTGKPAFTSANLKVRAAQQEVCENDPYSFLGPDTDYLVGKDANGKYYRNGNGSDVHFSYDGVIAHGKLWAEFVIKYFF